MSELYVIEKAASSDLATCETIMRKIYDENPSHWPYGLDSEQLRGGLYMVREASTRAPAGFVGWQEEHQGLRKIGYYSIGILPAYRRRGLAKSAVRQLLREKAAGVDEVRAMIHRTNAPSMALAQQLNIPIEKVAMEKTANPALRWLTSLARNPSTYKALGAGMAGAGLTDAVMYKDRSFVPFVGQNSAGEGGWSALDNLDKHRAGEALFNAAGYAAVPGLMKTKLGPMGGFFAGTSVPFAKILGSQMVENGREQTRAIQDASQLQQDNSQLLKHLGIGAGILGVGGLGLAAYNAFKPRSEEEQADAAREQIAQTAQGKIRITLPTKNPNDKETEIELPFNADTINMSNALQGSLGRDIRRRLRDEAKTRIRRRNEPIYNTALHSLS